MCINLCTHMFRLAEILLEVVMNGLIAMLYILIAFLPFWNVGDRPYFLPSGEVVLLMLNSIGHDQIQVFSRITCIACELVAQHPYSLSFFVAINHLRNFSYIWNLTQCTPTHQGFSNDTMSVARGVKQRNKENKQLITS